MVRSIFRAALAALVLAAAAPASAQDPRQNEPGQFDFYVLALSWSPSFCEAAAERGGSRNASAQCGARPYSFVVHGLWPQYTKGFPEYCQVPAPRLDREKFREIANRVKVRTSQKGKALFHPIRVVLTGRAEGAELDLVVPAIDLGAELPPSAGIPKIIGNRERAVAFARALEERVS